MSLLQIMPNIAPPHLASKHIEDSLREGAQARWVTGPLSFVLAVQCPSHPYTIKIPCPTMSLPSKIPNYIHSSDSHIFVFWKQSNQVAIPITNHISPSHPLLALNSWDWLDLNLFRVPRSDFEIWGRLLKNILYFSLIKGSSSDLGGPLREITEKHFVFQFDQRHQFRSWGASAGIYRKTFCVSVFVCAPALICEYVFTYTYLFGTLST